MDRDPHRPAQALARDASLERSDYLVRAAEQFQRFLTPTPRDQRDRRADPDRRGSRLPGDRARPGVPEPEPLPRRRDRRVAQRDRGRRDRPPSWSSCTARPSSSRRSPRRPATAAGLRRAEGAEAGDAGADERRGACRRRRRAIRTRRRPTRGRPARTTARSAGSRTPPAACTTWPSSFQERSQRSEARPGRALPGRGRGRYRPSWASCSWSRATRSDSSSRPAARSGRGRGRGRRGRADGEAPRRSGSSWRRPRSWSASTIRPMSSATWPTPWPRPSRRSRRPVTGDDAIAADEPTSADDGRGRTIAGEHAARRG